MVYHNCNLREFQRMGRGYLFVRLVFPDIVLFNILEECLVSFLMCTAAVLLPAFHLLGDLPCLDRKIHRM